jgi:hypothetical protein
MSLSNFKRFVLGILVAFSFLGATAYACTMQALALLAVGSPLERLQHPFRAAETIVFHSEVEMTQGTNANRQDVVLRLTVKEVGARVGLDAQETVNGATSKTRIDLDPASGIVRNRKGEDIAMFSPLMIAYTPTLWGELPANLARGSSWSTDSPAWIFGPQGRETVAATAYDPSARTLSFTVTGSGTGPARPEIENPDTLAVDTRSNGASAHARMVPLKTSWKEAVDISDGLIAKVRIEVNRDYRVPQTSMAPEFHLARRIVETITRM